MTSIKIYIIIFVALLIAFLGRSQSVVSDFDAVRSDFYEEINTARLHPVMYDSVLQEWIGRQYMDSTETLYASKQGLSGHISTSSISIHQKLEKVAEKRAIYMAKENYFTHYDRKDRYFKFYIQKSVGDVRDAGECIHMVRVHQDFDDGHDLREAVKCFMYSKGHRDHLLKGGYDAAGIGVAMVRRGEWNVYYVVVELITNY